MPFDITQPATYVPIIAGVIIPAIVAVLTKANASPNIKSLLAILAAALTSLGLYLSDTSHVQTWAGAASAFVLALVIAGASRVTLTEHIVAKIQAGPGLIGPAGPSRGGEGTGVPPK